MRNTVDATMILAALVVLAVVILGGCANVREDNIARAAYFRAECEKAGYVVGTAQHRGCVSAMESSAAGPSSPSQPMRPPQRAIRCVPSGSSVICT